MTTGSFGGILEIIVALAGIGTAVALYPVVKRQSEGRALGFVVHAIGRGQPHRGRGEHMNALTFISLAAAIERQGGTVG